MTARPRGHHDRKPEPAAVPQRIPDPAPPGDDSATAASQDPHGGRLAYSVDEAARLIGLSRDLLYDQMRRGNLANVNRWRGQLQLPPVADLTDAVQPLAANGLNLLVFDAANGGSRILGAIVPRPGETWFFKLTGPDALVAREKPAFLDFLRTVKAP